MGTFHFKMGRIDVVRKVMRNLAAEGKNSPHKGLTSCYQQLHNTYATQWLVKYYVMEAGKQIALGSRGRNNI